jgi:hypothetical protein
MSIFNTTEFNSTLFGESGSAPSSPSVDVYLSANIAGNSSVSASTGFVTLLSTLIEGSSIVTFSRMRQLKGFRVSTISGGATVNPFLSKTANMSTEINGGSSYKAGTFLYAFDVHGITTVESGIHADYAFNDTIFGGSSLFSATPRFIFSVSSDISGKSIVLPDLHMEKIITTSVITGSSSVSVNTLDVFSRLYINGDETGILSSTSINATMTKLTGLESSIISGRTSFGRARLSVNYGGFGPTIFAGTSDLKSIKKLGELDGIAGRTIIEATLTAPESLKNVGSRRRISFVFEVDKPDTKSTIIDDYFKILRFYNSLSSLPETLEYVRRNAQREITGYDIDSTSHRAWTNGTYLSEGDLFNVKTGQRGVVQGGATGIFIGKDGQFGVYTGPTIVDGELG